jgi:wobble nucleotide-excising tRNase
MMITKITPAIKKITLNATTFNNVEFEPALINFFYGNNGTGKSTIGRVIDPKDVGDDNEYGTPPSVLSWNDGDSTDKYSVLIYNKAFVEANFQDYSNLKGVFTIGTQNIETQNQITAKIELKAEYEKAVETYKASKESQTITVGHLLPAFQEKCWANTSELRSAFSDTQAGFKKKLTFAERVLEITNQAEHKVDELKTLYKIAFDKNAKPYSKFQTLGGTTRLKGTRGNELLTKSIISSSDSELAKFIKRIKSMDWVSQGYEDYTDIAEGNCPYCGRLIPDELADEISACFDEQYQKDIDDLKAFREAYASDMQDFLQVLETNLQQELYPNFNLTEYNDKYARFKDLIEKNLRRIDDKIKEPSTEGVALEKAKSLCDEINSIIETYNEQVQANNDILTAKRDKQNECSEKVWQHIAFTLKDEVATYQTRKTELQKSIDELSQQIKEGERESAKLENEITELYTEIVSTLPTITSINNLLYESGFQGFWLREKKIPNPLNQDREVSTGAYEVIRHDKKVAKGLSEGERNFIAFLYFYHLVRGSDDIGSVGKDKIVVIDDPVSSMDSSVLFLVSTLVREMVEVCNNNVNYESKTVDGEYIKQLFVMTHNVYFHREITYNQAQRYDTVSFFLVNKASNISTIKHCEEINPNSPTEKVNVNPVQNSYSALWGEYKELNKAVPILNVIRRILEYYFMQLCGYDCVNIRKIVLDDNRDKFVEPPAVEDGLPDNTKHQLASAMLSYISANSVGHIDGLNFIDDCTDATTHKNVFKLIFEALQQEQHYNMMMKGS